ncbi:Amidase [plant metagenome]|uniref:Amidase n=1 Tax=plant metagenome TaxID=1297885 RepID=A0A484Q8W4_9ZZZZ
MTPLHDLTASDAATRLQSGALSCEAITRATLTRIDALEPQVRAYAHLAADEALQQARTLDQAPAQGALHGVTIAVKDVIDVAGMPTTFNTPAYAGHRPGRDAACVATARALGAVILGKTDTVEFGANGRSAATGNAYAPAHTPGGSSSGSAAAVASGMAQIAFGTQTGGSIIRPAAYNGVHAFKPTHGLVCAEGAKVYAPSLDTIGWFARGVADLALMARAFQLADAWPQAPATLAGLRIGVYKGPHWDRVDASGQQALLRSAPALADAGATLVDLSLPASFDTLPQAQQVIIRAEGRRTFLSELLAHPDQLNPNIRATAENAAGYRVPDLLRAQDQAGAARRDFDALLTQRLDLVLTPPSFGQAPAGLEDTGSPLCNSLWTLLHAPCLAVPTGLGDIGLPVGIQLVGPRGGDAQLLAWAEAIDAALTAAQGPMPKPALKS